MKRGNPSQELRVGKQQHCDTFWLKSLVTLNRYLANEKVYMFYWTVFALFYFEFEGNLQVQAPGGLYLEGWFNGGFFALRLGEHIFEGAYFRNFTVFRFRSYSFGIETINTFISSRGCLENHTWFQTKMGKVYTRFQTKRPKNPTLSYTYMAYIRDNPLPPSPHKG